MHQSHEGAAREVIRARRETVESLTGCAMMRNAFARTATRDWIVYHFE